MHIETHSFINCGAANKALFYISINLLLTGLTINPKNAFTVIKDKEKQHILTFKHKNQQFLIEKWQI